MRIRRHDPKLREKCVALMMLPDGPSANALSKEAIGVSQTTLSKWLREAKKEKELVEARRVKSTTVSSAQSDKGDNITLLVQVSIPRAVLVEAVLRDDEVIDLTSVIQLPTGTHN